ncbi:hypothetical protein TNCV_424311 [Trichonephila clavipes]|nr:hypothetical protein TNCV_424311 [Trichonephila clavipes]
MLFVREEATRPFSGVFQRDPFLSLSGVGDRPFILELHSSSLEWDFSGGQRTRPSNVSGCIGTLLSYPQKEADFSDAIFPLVDWAHDETHLSNTN